MKDRLPPPGADALEHSTRLAERIACAIREEGGWIGFDRFMALALFEPGLGYYSGGSRKFGPEGDFVTAPEISPLFGHALARQVCQIMQAAGPRIIEVGAGTGRLACDLLQALEGLDCLPERYAILELSGELRVRQQESLREHVPHLADRVVWLEGLPDTFSGVVLANEVLDVMPVQLVAWHDRGIFERGVVLDADGAFCWEDRPATGGLLAAARQLPVSMPEEGEYLSEICLAARAWVEAWSDRLLQGAMILIDYGYPQAEYYLPARSSGTLQCYYRHRAHPEVLLWPGLNDITSFVDFTAIAEAGHGAGFTVAGYTSQASFLNNCGLLALLAEAGPVDSAAYLRASRAALRLVAPHEMGELFKVLALTRGIDQPLLGMLRGDRTHAL
ncbi:class I SAM-dependent methyltransferase [Uliginosibacterium paludis]|uniref:SAM-dependent methyltransferase n=1 Tax=Uliginosibacterium paludis TaxID=1615952 RepID=A0ABV2CQL7_9RHOO